MSMPYYTASLIKYLSTKKISYEIVEPQNVPNNNYIRSILFKDQEGYLLAILPAHCILDVINVGRDLGRELKVVEAANSPYANFYDHNLLTYCPIPDLLNVASVIDQNIEQSITDNRVFIPYGQDNKYVVFSLDDFNKMQQNTWQADLAVKTPNNETYIGAKRIQTRINETVELPLMPPIANQLLKIKSSDTANISQLAHLVEQDPSLTAQLISWACSPYYGYKGKITSVNDAILNVLGFDLVINIALGIAISQKIRVPHKGPLGLKIYWKTAVYTASLVEKIIYAMPQEYHSLRGMGYLCGLLHNFGRLLIGQLFPAQFEMLNQLVYANPLISIQALEQYLLRVDENQIGQWLMQSWSMPQEVQTVVYFHNELNYTGDYAIFVDLIIVAKCILHKHGIGDLSISSTIPPQKLQTLHLQDSDVENIFQDFKEQTKDLEHLVNLLTGD